MNETEEYFFGWMPVRVQSDAAGVPWFNANDVCRVLGFSSPHAAVAKYASQHRSKRMTATRSGRQHANYISQLGIYALIKHSTANTAQPFQAWLLDTLLPTLQKKRIFFTPDKARYFPPHAQHTLLKLARVLQLISEQFAINPRMLAAATLACMHQKKNESTHKPTPLDNSAPRVMTAAQLADVLGCPTEKINLLLEARGLQQRDANGLWTLTPTGTLLAQYAPYRQEEAAAHPIVWSLSVAKLIEGDL
ncbi:hypothetical protein B398_04290 [Xylella fastidiosa 32]|uniref:BRO-N domain-containing protein n=1 Tax=Xylella fastidiosa TaxID=2371 RepID=UPI0003D2D700|nr:Bro-N domain-containing protein [Xylella fastidiosa]ETE33510.1 hypothetical protein B398_04290 [Xylella fastidiosa 32]KXB21609.1 hypothetical protein ADT30_03075 [Xylella fastidiosa]QPB73310.1 Bro-N domain-containing protein [Xylella fastidiosa]